MPKKITVLVRGRTAYLQGAYPESVLSKEWSYTVPGYRFMLRRFPGWDGKIKFLKADGSMPAGLFWATRKEIEEKLNVKFKARIARHEIEVREGLSSDREYQRDCVAGMFAAVRYGGGLVLNATGSGKTRIAAIFASRCKGPVCVIVDQLDLLEQAKKDFESVLGEKIGYVGNSVYEPRRVTIATIQTIHKHAKKSEFKKWLRSLDVVIVDEIHVQMGKRNFKSVEAIRPRVVYGLTATLELRRKEVRTRAYAIAGPVCYQYPIQQGMAEGILARGVGLAIRYRNDIPPDDEQSYQDKYLEYIVRNAERNDIIKRLARYLVNKKLKYVLIIVNRIKHLMRLSNGLQDVPHRLVYGAKEVHERIVAKKKFEKGQIKLLIANQVFKKGIDIKRLDAIINVAGLKSRNDVIQIFGRGVRQHIDKVGLMFFDLADYDVHPILKRIRDKDGKLTKRKKKVYHSFHVAAKRRKRSLTAIGITMQNFDWEKDGEIVEAYRSAEKLLAKELTKSSDAA